MKVFKSLSTFMMIFSLFLTSVVPANVKAEVYQDHEIESVVDDQLHEIFNRFQYALDVEWDQKDENFRKEAESTLKAELLTSGISPEEIQAYLVQKILKGKVGAEYSRLLNAMKSAGLDEEEATQMATDYVRLTSVEGVGFNGDGVSHHGGHWKYVMVAGAVVVVTLLVVFALKGNGDSDEGCEKKCTDIDIHY